MVCATVDEQTGGGGGAWVCSPQLAAGAPLRERFQFKEEAFHVFLAGIVGLIGGLANLGFFYATDWVKRLVHIMPGDPLAVA